MKFAALLIALIPIAGVADRVGSAFVCEASNGHKTVQDRPCPESAKSREVQTVHHDQDFNEWLDAANNRHQVTVSKMQCTAWRSSSAVVDRRRAADMCR